MFGKECKIVCDGKEVATIKCDKKGLHILPTEEGMKLCKEHCDCCE
jgi:hypothetical protein